jgi:PAS domain S-box-containing protein
VSEAPAQSLHALRHADWLMGSGEMADLIRQSDWSKTALGSRDQWPHELRTVVNVMLSAPIPIAIAWGTELLLLYNDRYRVIAQDRHPAALGHSPREAWPEVWHINQPIFERVLRRNESVFLENQLFQLRRSAPDSGERMEDTWFTLSYSPVFLETGKVGGVQIILLETTHEKRAKDEAAMAQESLLEAQKIAHLARFEYHAATRRTAWSDEVFRIFGLKPGQSSPSYDEMLRKYIHPEDVPLLHESFSHALETHSIYDQEHRIIRPSGEIRWIHNRAVPYFDAQGKLLRYIGTTMDVTDQKRMEDEVKRSELRYRTLFELDPNAIVLIDARTGTIIDTNQSAESLYGYTRPELIHLQYVNLTAEPDATFQSIQETLLRGKSTTLIRQHRKKNGTTFTVEVYAVTLLLDQKLIIMHVIHDISLLIESERALRLSQTRYQIAVEAMGAAFISYDSGGKITELNHYAQEILGLGRGQTFTGSGWPLVDEDGTLIPVDQQPVAKALRGHPQHHVVAGIYLATGQLIWLMIHAVPVQTASEPPGVVVTAFDISSRKQLEIGLRKRETLLNAMGRMAQVGGYEVDIATGVQIWTDEVYSIHEVDPTAFHPTAEIGIRFYAPSARPVIEEAWQRAVHQGEPYDLELEFITAKGNRRWVRAIGHPIVVNGKVTKVTGTFQDITARKRAEEQLRTAIELREEFLSVASHEIRTPLSALQLQLQLLARLSRSESSDSKLSLLSQSALQSTQDLIHLLDELLDLTRIRSGALHLDKEQMDLRTVVTDSVERIRESARLAGSSISVQPGLPVVGFWARDRIQQILSNLLSNAIKYGGGKPIEVTLEADRSERKARLFVKDHGVGISKEMQMKIFERYQRAGHERTAPGLGLGLYITKQLVEAHGGKIDVESKPPQGSTFIVELPLNGADPVAD